MKRLISSEESKEIAKETISEIAGQVKETLGPGGKPIILQRMGKSPDGSSLKPLITKDGVTVAEAIGFRDNAKEAISQAILQVAQNTVNQAGDGTTTAIVLAEAIYEAGYKHIKQGENGIQLYNALKDIKDALIDEINLKKINIEDEFILDVATISSNGDYDIAKIVYEAVTSVGEDGHIALEDGYSKDTTLEFVDGAMYRQGWSQFGPHGFNFVNDKSRNVCEMTDPAILLYAGKLERVDELGEFINRLMGANAAHQLTDIVPFLIIAHDYSDEVKDFIIKARIQQQLPIAAIKSPFDGSPNARTEMLEDIAVLVGATVGARGILELKEMDPEKHLGSAAKVEIQTRDTVIYNGYGDSDNILERVEDLKRFRETAMHEFDKENVSLRIGKLTGGIAVVRVGGDTEIEMLEKKDRIEDALCAAKVAIQDGILPGGGLTFYELSKKVDDSGVAGKIMKEALTRPIKQIITNVGENPEVILSHMEPGQGYDARDKKIVGSMLDAGIIDPAKVTKSALENAVSIAGLLLTTGGAVVVDKLPDGAPNPLAMMGLA